MGRGTTKVPGKGLHCSENVGRGARLTRVMISYAPIFTEQGQEEESLRGEKGERRLISDWPKRNVQKRNSGVEGIKLTETNQLEIENKREQAAGKLWGSIKEGNIKFESPKK